MPRLNIKITYKIIVAYKRKLSLVHRQLPVEPHQPVVVYTFQVVCPQSSLLPIAHKKLTPAVRKLLALTIILPSNAEYFPVRSRAMPTFHIIFKINF